MKTLLTATVLFAFALPAFAQGGPDGMDHDGDHHQHRKMMLEEADTNKDGTIDRAEFDAMRAARYAKLDPEGKGLSKADFPKAMERARAERRAEMQARMHERLDADNNGIVTKEEFLARNDEAFARMDRNGDGKLSKDDRRHER